MLSKLIAKKTNRLRVYVNVERNRRLLLTANISEQELPLLSTNSAGQSFTDASQLDYHYRLAQPEYDACIAKVGIQSGWHILDAGCGNGVFIPHIAKAVGSTGLVTAIDIAPENVQAVEHLAAFGTI